MKLKSYIAEHFKSSDLSPVESYISGEFHLRFELGGQFENGSKERVNQSLSRPCGQIKNLLDFV